jgi:hypothetical protein
MKKKVRLSRPGYKKGGAPHIAEQNETIDSISSGKRNVFLDRISNAAQEQMMNQAMMEAEEQFVPPQLYNYGGVPYYNVGGNFGFAMNPQAMANQSMYANALSDANADASNTGWFDNFGNIDFGKSEQMNIDPTTKEAKSWYKDYSKGYNKAMRRMNRGQSPFKNAYGGTPNYYEIGGPYDGGYGTYGTQSFEDYERWGNNSDVNAAVAPFWKSAWNDMWGIDNSMSRRAQDIRNTPGANVSANIGGNGSSEGLTMWEADKLERERKQRAEQDYDYKKALFDARRQQANQANNTSTQDVLNNTQSMIEGGDPYAAAQLNAQSIANNAKNIANRSNEREAASNIETTTTNVDDALKGKKKKTTTESTATTPPADADESTTTAADETTDERDLEGSMGADDVNGTSNTGTNAQGIQGNWLKAKGFRGAPVFMPIPSMNGQAGLTPGWDYEETKGGFMTPFKKQRRWSYNPQTGQNEPVSEAGDSMNQSGPDFNPELNVSNNQNQDVDYFGEKRTLGERARNMRNRFRRNEKLEGFAGDSETDVMLPGGIGAASEQGNMQFTNREPSAQYENPVPDYNTGYNQKQDDPNYIPEGGVSGPNNEYGEGWTQAEIDEFKEIYKNQRYGGVPNYFHGGVAHEPPPGFLEQMAKGVQYAIPDANTLNKIGQGVKGVIPYLTPHNPGQALVDQTLNNKDIKIGNRGFEDFNMLYDDPTSKAIKPFNNNTWTANQRLSPDAKAIAAAQRAEKLYNSYKNSNTPNQQYGGVVQELTQPEIDQILAMGGKVEYLD